MSESWIVHAKCRGMNVDLFFPSIGQQPGVDVDKVCKVCPVQLQCLDMALDDPKLVGIWGGTSLKRRREWRGADRAARNSGTS